MKNIKLYDFRIKTFAVLSDYTFLVLLLRHFGCFGLSRDCMDADKGSRAGTDREGQFLISGHDDGFPQRGRNQRRDSVFSHGVAKNAIIGVAVFIAFIVSIVFSFFSVLYVMG